MFVKDNAAFFSNFQVTIIHPSVEHDHVEQSKAIESFNNSFQVIEKNNNSFKVTAIYRNSFQVSAKYMIIHPSGEQSKLCDGLR